MINELTSGVDAQRDIFRLWESKAVLWAYHQKNIGKYLSKTMKKNPPVLSVTGILIEEGLTDEQLYEIQENLFEKVNSVLETVCSSINHVKFLGCHSYVYLEPTEENCFRCEHCGRWTTNYEEPNQIQGLPIGRKFEGMLICDECECWKYDPEYGWAESFNS